MQSQTSTRRRRDGKDLRYVHQLADGSWLAKVPDGKDPHGKLLYKRFRAKDVEVVIARRDEYLKSRQQLQQPRKLGRIHNMTLGEWLTHWLDQKVRRECSKTTYDNYAYAVDRYIRPKLGTIALNELTATRIETWRNGLEDGGLGHASVNYSLTRLKTALEVAIEPGRQVETGITRNVAENVKRLEEREAKDYRPDPSDTLKLVAAIGEHYMAAMPLVATDLGLRRGDVAGLHWGDVDLDAGKVYLRWHVVSSGHKAERDTRIVPGSKTRDGDELPLSPQSVAALRIARQRLREHRLASRSWKAGRTSDVAYSSTGKPYVVPQHADAPEALVFPASDGDVFKPGAMGQWFAGICRKAGVEKTMHSLRHDCATFLLNAGVPLPVVSAHMRHANSAITAKIYAHLLRDDSRVAADTFSRIWQAQEDAAQAV